MLIYDSFNGLHHHDQTGSGLVTRSLTLGSCRSVNKHHTLVTLLVNPVTDSLPLMLALSKPI